MSLNINKKSPEAKANGDGEELVFEHGALGVQKPPQDYRIFNRKQKDGTYRPLKDFFDKGCGGTV